MIRNKPQWIVLQLLEACNLRCKMCYEWGENGAYLGKKSATLDYEVVQRVIADTIPAKPFYALFGGEPMMYRHIDKVIRQIREGGSRVDIPTNGMLIKKHAEMLCETKPSRLWISLDGPKEINDEQRGDGVFDKVTEGIETLFELRETKGLTEPKIGCTFIVTPLTHMYIEEFFMKHIDLDKIDHLSIEFQTFATEDTVQQHQAHFKKVFGIPETPCAAGMLADITPFQQMDYKAITSQMKTIREACEKRGIYFVSYPKTIEEENIRAYFNRDIEAMTDKRDRCFFPWIYMEVAASGDVTPCHIYYDYPIGNVNETPILDIWGGDRLKTYRNQLKKGLFPICTSCARYYADPSKH